MGPPEGRSGARYDEAVVYRHPASGCHQDSAGHQDHYAEPAAVQTVHALWDDRLLRGQVVLEDAERRRDPDWADPYHSVHQGLYGGDREIFLADACGS